MLQHDITELVDDNMRRCMKVFKKQKLKKMKP